MKNVIKIKNMYGAEDKYILREEYNGFGIYEKKTPTGYFVNQSWLISNNEKTELVIESYNRICKEEVKDIIDNCNETGRYGVKVFIRNGVYYMHDAGKFMV